LAPADTRVAFVNGDDWLAIVNRSPTGALAPDYAPTDLVDLKDGRARTAAECGSQRECLRRDAAMALHAMFDAMRAEGIEGRVQSAFRGFGTQCWVFDSWARQARGGFCEATEQSALPGHSQHQLGTTLDVFTKEWTDDGTRTGRGVFRDGFGCTRGGTWLDDFAWRFGFVVPYPIHPDDRKDASRCATRTDRPVPIDPKTGYKSEAWHVRYIGVDGAARYHDAWLESRPGSPDEITLEQWLRAERGLVGDTELPVCDGCQCGACATLASDETREPCGKASLWLDPAGRVIGPLDEPRLTDVRALAQADGVVEVEATVHAPAHTPTQPPVFGRTGAAYGRQANFLAFSPYAGTLPHRYPDLPGAWRLAVEAVPTPATRWPWRASLASSELESPWNRANVVLPAKAGEVGVRVPIVVPAEVRMLRVTLLRDGIEHDTRELALP
jgi:D-alanyl-D-alanine carboxypeptidase